MRRRLGSFFDRIVGIVCCAILAVSLVAVLGGGSCHYHDDDDDCHGDDDFDDDDFNNECFDDDDVFSSESDPPGEDEPTPVDVSRRLERLQPVGRAGAEVLAPGLATSDAPASVVPSGPAVPDPSEHSYELTAYEVEASTEPGTHPVRRVTSIRELSLFELWGPGEYGAKEFAQFSARVRVANTSLLALPRHAGRLRFEEVLFTDTLVVVRWVQTAAGVPADGEPIAGAEQLFVYDLLGRLVQIENTTRVPAGTTPVETAPKTALPR